MYLTAIEKLSYENILKYILQVEPTKFKRVNNIKY